MVLAVMNFIRSLGSEMLFVQRSINLPKRKLLYRQLLIRLVKKKPLSLLNFNVFLILKTVPDIILTQFMQLKQVRAEALWYALDSMRYSIQQPTLPVASDR